ncbi:MAG: hypothetical protein IJ335_03205 [Lachnospiraceae bacterium]|nr:hypothetical protein [Lachnospiraceae bacterium]
MEAVIEQLLLLKPVMITTAVGTVLLTIAILLWCRKFSWNSRNIRIMGFFYEAPMRDSVALATCILKLFLTISLLFLDGKIEMVHIYFFGMLVLLYNLLRLNLKETGISLFNGLIIMGVLYVSNFLTSYLREVLFDVKIAIALVLMGIFLILYSAYDVMVCVASIVNTRIKTERKE